jgi:molecular chaperone DnaK (HSP70)
VTYDQANRLIHPFRQKFIRFIEEVLAKNLYEDEEINPDDISHVLCVGGGFEMLWAREVVAEVFKQAQVQFYKNAKVVTAEGAAVAAALMLDAAEGYTILLEDKHQLQADIGFQDGSRFLPLVERNAFWWQRHPPRLMLVNEPCGGDLFLSLAERNIDGDVRVLSRFPLEGLPERPKGTTKLQVQLRFNSNTELTVDVKDQGFGELFPRADFERCFAVSLG